ncbi:MAG: hypothetical protein ACPL3A_07155 [Thermoanaerobacteraceae bacterium]
MNKDKLAGLKIAGAYIGTVVGAGFASGQEVMQFFVYHGLKGIFGLIISVCMFVFYGYVIMKLGKKYNALSHEKVIMKAGGIIFGRAIDFIVTFFLFSALVAMFAGSSAVFTEQFNLPDYFGGIVMAVISVITVITGIEGVINAISFVVPFLLLSIFLIGFLIFFQFKITGFDHVIIYQIPPVSNFLFSGFLYASYNLLMSVAILSPLGVKSKDNFNILLGSLLGGLGLGSGAFIIFYSIYVNMPESSFYQVPMLFIVSKFSYTGKYLYSLILLLEIYTTAVSNLYGFTARVFKTKTLEYKIYVVITGSIALAASKFGFDRIVHYIYPIAGYAGIFMILGLTYGFFKNKEF